MKVQQAIRWLPACWLLAATLASGASPANALPKLGPLDEQDFRDGGVEQVDLQEPTYAEGSVDGFPIGPAPSCSECGYGLHLMPQGLIYRSYLAGAKESRFRSIWHEESNDGSPWDATLGGHVGILRYGTRGNVRPEGWQLSIEGASLLRLDRDEDMDVTATDYRVGVPLTWGDSVHQVKFAYYHLSSHLGDEFLLKNPGFNRLNYSRDVLVLGHSLYPSEKWRVYGEAGYGVNVDVCEPWEFQFGVDYGPNGRTGARGAPFAAFNGHLREEVDFGGNLVVQGGWAWRRGPATGVYRVGVEYYNGKDDQFSFFNESVQKIGLAMWYDY